ncbi:Ryncolin-4 [Holothuria leucospilota]|uniref:Ryncolin-4 n=1 Tax=Holothuria leucospilota TaxID=206669 RepID=A0A9Q1BWU7_HOLLE|nr:Ryncolin-4 [Holothuria leucospilota]
MTRLIYSKSVRLILCFCWTSVSVSSQNSNSERSKEFVGSSFFVYQQPDYPRDCTEVRSQCSTNNSSGVYLIKPDGYREPFEVFCDNTKDFSGWTVIYRIRDGSVLFNRNWTDYKTGFGFLHQEFWIGNDKLSFLTSQKSYELRLDVISDAGLSFYVSYNRFRVGDEYSEYKLISDGEWNGTEEKINQLLCSVDKEDVGYISPRCSQRCFCSSGQYVCDVYQCSTNATCEERNNVVQCYCNTGYTGDGVNCIAISDCQDVYDRVSTESGIYKIKPTTWQGDPFDVYCNMTDGGDWTVFQRRVDGSQNSFLYWSDYRDGFATPERELWLGNDKLHSVTSQKNYELRVDVVDRLSVPFYAKHSSFSISDEDDNFTLSLGSYSEGNAGDNLNHINGQPFTTRDRDNDAHSGINCATLFHPYYYCGTPCSNNAGWWYKNSPCSFAHLNSPYGSTCLRWYKLPGEVCIIKYTEMKIRPT